MGDRIRGPYFGVYENRDAVGNKPHQTGKMLLDADIINAIVAVGKQLEQQGEPVEVQVDLGFYEKVGKQSGNQYLWGRPSVWVPSAGDPPPRQAQREQPKRPQPVREPSPPAQQEFQDDEIPF